MGTRNDGLPCTTTTLPLTPSLTSSFAQVYYMFADSDEEKDDWIGKIGRAIVDHSRSHIRQDAPADDDYEDSDDDDDDS